MAYSSATGSFIRQTEYAWDTVGSDFKMVMDRNASLNSIGFHDTVYTTYQNERLLGITSGTLAATKEVLHFTPGHHLEKHTQHHKNSSGSFNTSPVYEHKFYYETYNDPTTIAGYPASTVNLYPNPSVNTLFIEAKGIDQADATLRVIDCQGRVILRQCAAFKSGRAETDVSHLSPGLHFFTMEHDGIFYTGKFVKQ